jgi:hypothetical protein
MTDTLAKAKIKQLLWENFHMTLLCKEVSEEIKKPVIEKILRGEIKKKNEKENLFFDFNRGYFNKQHIAWSRRISIDIGYQRALGTGNYRELGKGRFAD